MLRALDTWHAGLVPWAFLAVCLWMVYLTFLSLFSYDEGRLSNNTLWEYWEN